jgi:hypothetical protein
MLTAFDAVQCSVRQAAPGPLEELGESTIQIATHAAMLAEKP